MAAITWNPSDKDADITLQNSNLEAYKSAALLSAWKSARGFAFPTGYKFYVEFLITGSVGSPNLMLGIVDATADLTTYIGNNTGGTGAHGWALFSDGTKFAGNAQTGPITAAYTIGDTVQMAFDPATGKLWFGVNNTWSGDPVAGTGQAFTIPTGVTYYPGMSDLGGKGDPVRLVTTAGSRVYTPPTGYTSAGDSPTSPIVGSATIAFSTTGTAKGIRPVVATAALTFGSTANIGSNKIGGTAALTFSAAGTAALKAPIVGASSITFGSTGGISNRIPIAATATIAFSATGSASSRAPMVASTSLSFTLAANISSSRAVLFRQKWLDVYSTRQALLNKIADVIRAKADSAQATADAAAAQATAANAALADIASDNLLTPGEKPTVRLDYDTIINEQAGIDASADMYLVTTEKATYDAAVTALSNYLTGLTAPTLWSDVSGNTTIVGATFRAKFAAVYSARQAVLNKIVNAAPAVAGDTLVLNAECESDIGWDKEAQWYWQSGAFVRGFGGITAGAVINQKRFSVTPGQQVKVSGLITNAANAANGQCAVGLHCINDSGTFIGLPMGNQVTTGSLVRSSGTVTVPAGATKAAVCFYVSSHTTGYWVVDSARCSWATDSLDDVPDGSTYGRIDLTDTYLFGTRRLGLRVPGSGHRIGDNRNLPMIMVGNGRAKVPATITYSASAGTPATATISVSAFTLLGGDYTLAYSASSVGVTGTSGGSTAFYLYMDDATQVGGARTLVATTNGNDLYASSGRLYIGDCTVVFPASGSGSGGGGRDPYCVTEAMWLDEETRAGAVVDGQLFDVIDMPRTFTTPMRARALVKGRALEACVRITTTEGFVLECSRSTPFDLPDGGDARACDMVDQLVWTDAGWQFVATVEDIGERWVIYLSFGGRSYAAGADPFRRIYSHNLNAKP